MKKNSFKYAAIFSLIVVQSSAHAGNLFNVSASGVPTPVNVTLCLNAFAQLSCQNYSVPDLTLLINTTIPNHTYPKAGIRVNTPGFSAQSGCTPLNGSDFCIFQASDANLSQIIIGPNATLYGATGLAGGFTNTLFTINTKTAFPTMVMPMNSNGDGSIIASDGITIYHFTINLFESLDLELLTTTEIPMSGPSFSEPYGAVFFNSANAFLMQKRSAQEFMTVTTGGVRTFLASNSRRRGFACWQHRIYGVEQEGTELNEINPVNGAILSTVPLSVPGEIIQNALGLTVNPNTGVFYVLLRLDGEDRRRLATVNIDTGVATLIGLIDNGNSLNISSITFHPADPTC